MSTKLGKVGHHFIENIITKSCGNYRPEVRAGAKFGVDVSVVDIPGNLSMALTSDPLSLIPSLGLAESAWLSVHLMANDMATTGFAPMYGQFVLNLPASFSKNDFKTYWDYIHKYCSKIGTAITGGHTGFIEGQESTIAGGGTFITVAPTDKILLSSMAKPGDRILITKQCGISSAAILAMSFPETVKNRAGKEVYDLACESFYHTSSLQDALIATNGLGPDSGVTAMHDVTEGGVLGAIFELAVASKNGALIYNYALPKSYVQESVCNVFSLDYRYCIGAGSMIITCNKDAVYDIGMRLFKNNISCVEVGVITDKDIGIKLEENEKLIELPYYEEDPYWSAFFTALKMGWK